MRRDTDDALREFYRPHNARLAALLGDAAFTWSDLPAAADTTARGDRDKGAAARRAAAPPPRKGVAAQLDRAPRWPRYLEARAPAAARHRVVHRERESPSDLARARSRHARSLSPSRAIAQEAAFEHPSWYTGG